MNGDGTRERGGIGNRGGESGWVLLLPPLPWALLGFGFLFLSSRWGGGPRWRERNAVPLNFSSVIPFLSFFQNVGSVERFAGLDIALAASADSEGPVLPISLHIMHLTCKH